MRAVRTHLLIVFALAGCADPGPPAGVECAAPLGRPEGLVVAGSGSNLPLVRAIAERYRKKYPDALVQLPDSIGTGGAWRALADGAIDVGLASRRLEDKERKKVGSVVPLARSPLAMVAHVQKAELSRQQIVDVFSGKTRTWPDGTPVVPVLREVGDSGYPVLAGAFPELHAVMKEALALERWAICYSDQEMRDTLVETEGAVGLLDVGIVRLSRGGLPLRVLGGPSLEKPLSFLLPAQPKAEATRFVEFARSPEVADLLAAGGYKADP